MIHKGQKIHSRKITFTTYEGASDAVVVEGVLYDERFTDMYLSTGEVHPPGSIHHMIIRLEVTNPDLTIKDIEVEMPTVPHEDCLETQRCLDAIKGLSIVSGFTAKVKRLVGGTKGCYHLVALLTAMAPAVVQGAWSALSREPLDPKIQVPIAMERMRNTCRLWRDDGPIMENLRQMASSNYRLPTIK